MSDRPVDTAMISRCLRALSRQVGDGALHQLPELVRLRDELDGHILDAVARLRAEPWSYSWSAIGRTLGITPQSAAERFHKAGGARRPGGQPAHLR
jgi:hypothetical protein